MRIGIPLVGGKFWHGGVTYVEALAKSLRGLPEDQRPRVYFIVDKVTAAHLPVHLHFATMIDGVIAIGDVPAMSDDRCVPTTRVAGLRELVDCVDFIFPVNTDIMPGFCHASWIPDFQHRHLRQLFSAEDFDRRESAIRDVLEFAQLIVVCSDAVKKDLMNLYDDSGERVRVLPFHVGIDQAWLEADPAAKRFAYGLPDNFVICCNQFWQHKNHEVLFRALARTRNRINLVCTGATEDYRNRDWFARLTALIEELGIQSRVFLSGFIPRFDQIQLMRYAIAVVQPSLFEGWSSILEEARALGKPVLASNLAVHEERAVPRTRYFSPTDADELVMLLDEAYACHAPGPDRGAEQIAQREFAIEQELAGRKIMMIAAEAVSGFNATNLGNCSKSAAVERILMERIHSLMDQVTEKEEVIQRLQAKSPLQYFRKAWRHRLNKRRQAT
jgi:glycosyltransferase involved in cell wall biosynthesis